MDGVGLFEDGSPFLLCKQRGLLQVRADIYGVFKKTEHNRLTQDRGRSTTRSFVIKLYLFAAKRTRS